MRTQVQPPDTPPPHTHTRQAWSWNSRPQKEERGKYLGLGSLNSQSSQLASSRPLRDPVSKRQNGQLLRNDIPGCFLLPTYTHTHMHLHTYRHTNSLPPTLESRLITWLILINAATEPHVEAKSWTFLHRGSPLCCPCRGGPPAPQCKQAWVRWLHNQVYAMVSCPLRQGLDNC